MSYMVARMQKMKSGNLGGIERHNQRTFENHSNPDIDPKKQDLNYDLVNDEPINYKEKIHQININFRLVNCTGTIFNRHVFAWFCRNS